MVFDFIYTVFGIAFLYIGAELLVRSSVSISHKFRVQPLLVGLVIIGLGTSSPELVVSIRASIAGSGEIAVGNIVGSNISNVALILGIGALIWPVKVDKSLLKVELPVLIAASLLMTFLVLNGLLTRLNGVILIAGLIFYLFFTIRNHFAPAFAKIETVHTGLRTPWLLLGTVGGLALLILGAELMIAGSLGLAEIFQLSEAVIGLTVVAVGTSLPELATAVVASVRKEGELILGGLIGSNILNILFVLGVTASINPIELVDIDLIDLMLMTLLVVLLWPIFRTGYSVNRLEGGFLVLVYTGYILYLFMQ